MESLRWSYREPHFHFDPAALKVPGGTNLWGYFQSERYFAHVASEVRSAYAFHSDIREAAQRIMARVANGFPKVALHVRRGDYLAYPESHPVLPMDYDQRALSSHFHERTYQVLIFTDDPAWCEAAFPGRRIVHSDNAYVDLCVMTRCDHFVIANSSFSWWGAWLCPSSEKVVVAPRRWFGPKLAKHQTHDLRPESWHCL